MLDGRVWKAEGTGPAKMNADELDMTDVRQLEGVAMRFRIRFPLVHPNSGVLGLASLPVATMGSFCAFFLARGAVGGAWGLIKGGDQRGISV